MKDLKDAIMSMDLTPTSVVFFDRAAVDGRELAELNLDYDFSVMCIPVMVPHDKTIQECIVHLDMAKISDMVAR